LILRSISNSTSIRLSASSATGEIAAAFLPRRALVAILANPSSVGAPFMDHTGNLCTNAASGGGGSSGTPTMTSVSVGTSSAQLVAAAAFANFLKVCVPSTAANGIWVRWDGGTATQASPAEYMPPGQCDSWVKSTGFLPTGTINAIASAAVAVSVNGN